MRFLLSVCLICSVTLLMAQDKNKPAALPKVTSTLGGLKGGEISAEVLSRIVDSALVVRDDKGNLYPITRFRSIYKFKSSYEDPQTGERKITDDMRVNDFKNTSVMPALWRQSIKDNIMKGDQLILDNVIIQLKNGAKLMAPTIHFTVIN